MSSRNYPGGTRRILPKWLAQVFALAVLLAVTLSFHLIMSLRSTVRSAVRSDCSRVGAEDLDECHKALIRILISEDADFRIKNRAIWTLGQLGNESALPVLEALYTGEECEQPCRQDRAICQYGLEKAISLCSGDTFWERLRRQVMGSGPKKNGNRERSAPPELRRGGT